MLDYNVRTGANFNRIDTEYIGHDFEVAGIADFQERRARDVPAFDRRVRTI